MMNFYEGRVLPWALNFMRSIKICATLAVLSYSGSSFCAEISSIFVPDIGRKQSLENHLEYLEDPNGRLTLEQIVNGGAGSFKPLDKSKTLGYAYKNQVLWVRFSIDVRQHQERDWLLSYDYEHVSSMRVFYPTRDGFGIQEMADNLPSEGRMFSMRQYVFKLPVSAVSPSTYYVRFAPGSRLLKVALSWSDNKGMIESATRADIPYALFFGGMLAMLLYNAILCVSLRDKAYLYYVYYLAAFIIEFFHVYGFSSYAFQLTYFWEQFFAACGYASVQGMILFARHFLMLKMYMKWTDRYLTFFQWCLFVGGCAVFLQPVGQPFIYLNFIIVLALPAIIVAGICRWYQGYSPARIYIFGWVAFAIALMLLALRSIGLLPSNIITNYATMVASLWEAIMFSLALAYRIKLIEQEKNAAIDEHAKRELKILEDERSRLEQRVAERTASLEASLESRRMMLANASHELRTPVNALRLLLDSTSNPVATDTTVIPSVSTIANHMSQLVENLLLLDEGSQSAQCGPIQDFDLGDELRATAAMLGPLRHGSAAQFNLDVDACLGVMVRGDLTSLRRVIINLLSNAFKFTEQGSVSLTASVRDAANVKKRDCIIRVNDTGVGIAPSMHEQVFGVFVTSDGQVGHTGTGLGLAISRQLALNMNGSLTLVRSAPGVGSEFEFRACFDASRSPNFSAIEGVQSAGQESLPARRLNVLVAEDDPITAQAVLLIVLQLRHDVTLAETYDELCTAFQRAGPAYDVALIDHRLPGGNGLTAIEQYRASCPAAATRMILVTADVTPEVLNAARTICDEIVTKPTTAHVLRQLLGEGPPIAYQPTTDAREIVDAGPLKMLDRCGAQHQALIQMCATFNKTVGNTLIDIESRLAKCDGKDGSRADLEKIIHRMRGSCATIGATALAEDFKALAVCDSRVAAQRKYASMVDTFHRTRKALHDLLSKMKAA